MDVASRAATGIDATRGENWALIGAGGLLLGGVFADGWAHSNILDELESFITPWHSIIFIGYLVAIAVVGLAIRRRLGASGSIIAAIPLGWRAAAGGVAVFAVGFLGDGAWHTIYGIEADLEALLSPTHLLMFIGAMGISAAPLMSAWRRPTGRAVAWAGFGPVAAAMTLLTSGIAFFFLWAWHIGNGFMTVGFANSNRGSDNFLFTATDVWAISAFLLTAAWMVGPFLFLLSRWHPPAGVFATMVLVPTVLLSAVQEFAAWPRLIGVGVGVAIAERMLARFQPGPEHRLAARVLVAVFVVVTYGLDMVINEIRAGLAWAPEFVSGSVVFSALFAVGLSYLAFPPASPEPAEV